jgi:lysophospholipase L1-like esterase
MVLRGQYMKRLEKAMDNVKVKYDWVIIQAGGNDLAWNNTPEAIFEGLKAVWDIPLKAGAKVLYVLYAFFSISYKCRVINSMLGVSTRLFQITTRCLFPRW